MKSRLIFLILCLLFSFNSCCFVEEEYLGNNMYLSSYDKYDIRILYQEYSCADSGIEIVPMTVLEISYNAEWIIAKSGYKRKNSDFKYWVIKNNYESLPNYETVLKNRIEFNEFEKFQSHLAEKNIELKLKSID